MLSRVSTVALVVNPLHRLNIDGGWSTCHRDAMKAIEAVIADASSLQPQEDDEAERPLSDGSEDDPDAMADEGTVESLAIGCPDVNTMV